MRAIMSDYMSQDEQAGLFDKAEGERCEKMAKKNKRKCVGCDANCSDAEIESLLEERKEQQSLLEQRELDLLDLEGEVALLRDVAEEFGHCFHE